MHYKSLILYKKWWRVGYYDGITLEDWDKYCKSGNGNGATDNNWTWIDDCKFKWYLGELDRIPHPRIDYEKIRGLAKGFVWACVPPQEER